MLDTLSLAQQKSLATDIKDNIDAYSKSLYSEEGPRTHLGISVIGEPCSRKIWLGWRWANFGEFDGRMLRLFNRGHREEERLIAYLKGVGFTVHETNPETGKQWRLSYLNGHYGGSCDGLGYCPPAWGYSKPIGFEFKTHNQKKFDLLKKEGVQKAFPKYYKQICSYGKGFNAEWFLYIGVNKNDDAIWPEWVKVDPKQADASYLRAEAIITSQTPPPKIAEVPTFFDCKYCDAFRDICHHGKPPLKNCRSCARARPVEDAQWYCDVHKANIPKEVIPLGCASYARII